MFTYHVYNMTAMYQTEPHTSEDGGWRVVNDNIVSMNTGIARDQFVRKHNIPNALSTVIWHIHEITRLNVPNEVGMAVDAHLANTRSNGCVG